MGLRRGSPYRIERQDPMYSLPEFLPISELRSRQNELLTRIWDKPLVLTRYGRSGAVLLGPKHCNCR